jgi:hypothetical protein
MFLEQFWAECEHHDKFQPIPLSPPQWSDSFRHWYVKLSTDLQYTRSLLKRSENRDSSLKGCVARCEASNSIVCEPSGGESGMGWNLSWCSHSAHNCSRNIECRNIQIRHSWSYCSALSATAPAYEIYISQMIRYSRACGSYQDCCTWSLSRINKIFESVKHVCTCIIKSDIVIWHTTWLK